MTSRHGRRAAWIGWVAGLLLAAAFQGAGASGAGSFETTTPGEATPAETVSAALIRVNATCQKSNFHRPWESFQPFSNTAIGAVTTDGRVLVTAALVANHRFLEFEKIDTGEKLPAILEVVDYEANLALLRAAEPAFLAPLERLELDLCSVQGDMLTVWQVNPNGSVIPSPGPVTAIEPAVYLHGNRFLAYRLNNSLQYRHNNVTLPVTRNGRLAGLLMRYDAAGQTIDVVAAPVIDHFLKDAADGDYAGFPLAGFGAAGTEDPQLRKFAGLPEDAGGAWVERVVGGGPADRAGLQAGDIVLRIDGFDLDRRGNYTDPLYGPMELAHLIRTVFAVGQKLPLTVWRDRDRRQMHLVLDHRSPDDYLVPPYVVDRPPRYVIVAGLVMQELSRPYLKAFGRRWRTRAPVHLRYHEQNRDYPSAGGIRRIVVLSSVLPTEDTIGFEDLEHLEVTRINGMGIHRLEDVPAALAAPVDGFHRIELAQQPRLIFLDAAAVPRIDARVKERYHLPALSNVGGCPVVGERSERGRRFRVSGVRFQVQRLEELTCRWVIDLNR